MTLEFTDKQHEAMDAIASERFFFILFGGALGGGKTIWGLSALLLMCKLFPGSRWCVVREDMEKLRTTTIPSFKKLMPTGRLKESPYEYIADNGSVIIFKGENYANDKEGLWLRGLEVNGFLFEEINECQEQTLMLAFSRAGRWECTPRPKPIVMATCNPANNWVKDLVYDRWKEGTLPANWLYIPSRITDNPHLTDEYRENLKNLPRYQYEVLVEGNWDIQLKTGGEFYKSFELDKHVAECGYDPSLALHVSWDDNVNPYLPCGIFQIKITASTKEVRMIDEVAGVTPNNTIKAVCREIIRRYPAHSTGLFIYGDATADKEDTKLEKGTNFYSIVRDNLSQYRPSMRVLESNPSVIMRGNWINTVLEMQRDDIVISIDPRCKLTINDFILTKEDQEGKKLKEMDTDPKTKGRFQKTGHFTDLTDYLLCRAFQSEFIRYQKGGLGGKVSTGKSATSKNTY